MTDTTATAEAEESKLFDFEGTRGLRYVELFAIGPEWITVYNSIGLSDGPPDLWDATDETAAAQQLGVGKVLKNGPHWWASDKLTARYSVAVTTVNGIAYRTVARLPAFIAQSGKIEPPHYTVVEANKEGVNVYAAGEPIYELISPDGDAFVLQSTNIPPEELTTLGERLVPAEGWQFRTRVLDEELTMVMAGKVKVAADELKNIYNMPPTPAAAQPAGEAKDLDVLIAVYPGPDQAQQDFEAYLKLVEDKAIRTEGVILVTRDEKGELQVKETGDHAARKGALVGGGVGLVVGLFAPPLLAATAVGAAGGAIVGHFAKKRATHKIAEAMDEKLPPGAAAIVAVYDHEHAGDVDRALGHAFTKSAAGIDNASADELKAGLQEAQAGLGG
jgi:uncharacterized membrane protein